jgi:hypothetical protein
VSKNREDRIGVLVIRASVEGGHRRHLLVQLLQVNPSSRDRVIGIVASSAAASQLVGEWLDSLQGTAEVSLWHQSLEGDR